ncbi:MAG: hypothetical protein RL514_3304 [Verrucomicrobiota bacterium]
MLTSLALLLVAFPSRADTLATLDGKSFTGKISFEAGTFVITRTGMPPERVPLTAMGSVAFDRAATVAQPSTWTALSVGAVPAEGHFTQSNGVFRVTGAGTAYQVDDGHFFVQQSVGEMAQLTVFVPPQVSSRLQEKFKVAGLALLSRFDGGGPAFFLLAGGSKSGLTRWRTATGKETSKSFTLASQGLWLRLERCAQQVSAFASEDGKTWRMVGNELLPLPDEAHLGLLVTGLKKGAPVTVAFSGVNLQHAGTPPAPLPQLRLRDGGILSGKFLSTDGSVVRWHALGREWEVSLVNVSRLLLEPRAETQVTRLRPERPGALLANGDFVDGELLAGEPGRLRISSVLFGIRSYSAEGSVLAVLIRDVAEAGAQFEIHSADGSRLLVNQLELRAEGIAGRERNAGEFLLRSADVSALRRLPARP